MFIKTVNKYKMNCRVDTATLRVLCTDSNNICVSHCCYRDAERNAYLNISDVYKMPDEEFWDYLCKAYKEIPSTHDYKPTYYCNTNQELCLYNDKQIDTIEITTFTHCNIVKCKMCMVSNNQKLSLQEDKKLYFSILEKVRNHNLKTIVLTTRGEPFLCKSETFEYLNSLTLNDCKNIRLITNTLLLTEDDVIKLSEIQNKTGINIEIICSCSGITPESYFAIHKNNNFDHVINIIKLLKKYNLLMYINFVIQNENLHELEFLLDFWAKHGIDKSYVASTPIIGFEGDYIVKTPEYIKYKF